MFELMDNEQQGANIKIVGVGGGGGNAVKNMIESGIEGVEFICANTDAQALKTMGVKTLIQLGSALTKGLGAGANPEIGREAALEDREMIKQMISGADMLFITAGMGGGTGTGAAPVVAEMAKELGILTVAVVTKPFPFEGSKRMSSADKGIEELGKYVDSLITIPNEKLLTSLGKNVTLLDAFKAANDVLLNAVQGIAELITRTGMINVDFADVRTVMTGMGMSMMGTGVASGDERASKAARAAISSPLLEDISLHGARGILVNITAGLDMGINEFDEVGNIINEFASPDATVVVGSVIDPEMTEELRVTIVATGLGVDQQSTADISAPQAAQTVNHLQPVELDQSQYQPQTAQPQYQRQAPQQPAAQQQPAQQPQQQPQRSGDLASPRDRFDRGSSRGAGRSDGQNYLDIPAFLRNQAD